MHLNRPFRKCNLLKIFCHTVHVHVHIQVQAHPRIHVHVLYMCAYHSLGVEAEASEGVSEEGANLDGLVSLQAGRPLQVVHHQVDGVVEDAVLLLRAHKTHVHTSVHVCTQTRWPKTLHNTH